MNGIVQAKLLGGFGNQLHQYTAARVYAETVGAELQMPPDCWTLQYIFGFSHPPWSRDLPEVNDGGVPGGRQLEWGETNVRLAGYCQMQRWVGLMSRAKLRQWLTVRPELEGICGAPRGSVAAHLRRGDYVGHPIFCTVTKSAYEKAAEALGRSIDTWADQDHPRPCPAGLHPDVSYLADWLALARASVLFRANSTFSWWAAALSDADVYAPVVEDRIGEHEAFFVRGNWPRIADTARTGVRIDDLHLPEGS